MKILITTNNSDIITDAINVCGDSFINMKIINFTASILDVNLNNTAELDKIHLELKNLLYSKQIDYLIYSKEKKKLLFCDMDKTLVAIETMDRVAEKFGVGDEVHRLTLDAMTGKADILLNCSAKLRLLKGVDLETVMETVRNEVVFNEGAKELAKASKEAGLYRVICTGGYDKFAEYVRDILYFDNIYCNKLEIIDGKLTGDVVGGRMSNEHSKKENLEKEIARLRISKKETIAVGDGANDVPMLLTAGLGIAYKAKDFVKNLVPNQINFTDLSTIIYTFDNQI